MDNSKWKRWPYKNTTILMLSLILFFYFIGSPKVQDFIAMIGSLGYLGSFISGIFFVSMFTMAPASAIIFEAARILDPLLIAITAGLGAMVGDYIIFRFLKDQVFEELLPLWKKTGGSMFKKIFSTPFFSWFVPIFGAFLIASPLPDEVGIGMLGLSKIASWQFLLITWLLNSIGIFLIIIAARSL